MDKTEYNKYLHHISGGEDLQKVIDETQRMLKETEFAIQALQSDPDMYRKMQKNIQKRIWKRN